MSNVKIKKKPMNISDNEIAKLIRKLKLFLALHGGVSYWKNQYDGREFCNMCPYNNSGCTAGDKNRLCIATLDNLGEMSYRRRIGTTDWCAEWIRYV